MNALTFAPLATAIAGGIVGFLAGRSWLRHRIKRAWDRGFHAGNTYAIAAHERALRVSGVLGAEAAKVGDQMAAEIEAALAADIAAGKPGVPNG